MSEKWTSGPWFVRESPTDDGLAVIEDGRQDGLFPIICEYGEAHLVAAAPDMYAALEALTEKVRQELAPTQPMRRLLDDPLLGPGYTALSKARNETDTGEV